MRILETYPALARHSLFEGADWREAERYWNEQTVRLQRFREGDTVYSSETEDLRVGILMDGTARIQTGNAHESILLRTVRAGEIFGIANLYAAEEPFPTRIVAGKTCEILFVDGDSFRAFVENDRAVLRNYLALQSRKIVYLNRKIAIFTAGSAEKKLAVFLVDYESDGIFTPPCSMSRLSDMLGMGRASLYRAMERLEEQGLIERRDKLIFIQNKDALLRLL